MAIKRMTKSKGPKMKKYEPGGTTTSDRSFNLFGKNYGKTLTRTQNDDGSVTKNKVKTVSKDGELLKKKEISRTTDNGYLTKSNRTKTEYMGDGDSKTKSRGYNLPSNLSEEKKGGSVKSKKIIKSKKK